MRAKLEWTFNSPVTASIGSAVLEEAARPWSSEGLEMFVNRRQVLACQTVHAP